MDIASRISLPFRPGDEVHEQVVKPVVVHRYKIGRLYPVQFTEVVEPPEVYICGNQRSLGYVLVLAPYVITLRR